MTGRLSAALRLRWLWLKHCHGFNWAHKPLCGRFAGDVVRLGGVHLCRSCLFAWSGVVLGALLCVVFRRALGERAATILLTALPPTLLFSLPAIYKHLPRTARDLLRAAGGLLLSLSACALFVSPLFGAAGLALLFIFWFAYFRVRRARKLRECDGCPELAAGGICSGFRRQAERIRRYEEEATGFLIATGRLPDGIVAADAGRAARAARGGDGRAEGEEKEEETEKGA